MGTDFPLQTQMAGRILIVLFLCLLSSFAAAFSPVCAPSQAPRYLPRVRPARPPVIRLRPEQRGPIDELLDRLGDALQGTLDALAPPTGQQQGAYVPIPIPVEDDQMPYPPQLTHLKIKDGRHTI